MRTTTVRLASRSLAAATAALLLAGAASTASAHSLTVQPPSQDDPVVTGPISRAWAQAHCVSQAPYVAFESSNGVVKFGWNILVPLTCDAPNPGDH